MRHWLYRDQNGKEHRATFEGLAEYLAAGEISESTLVKRSSESEFSRVDSVVGLQRAAQQLVVPLPADMTPANESEAVALRAEEPTQTKSINRWDYRSIDWLSPKLFVPAVVALGMGFVWWRINANASRFPTPIRPQSDVAAHSFRLVGNVSAIEFWLLVFDVVLVAGVAIWFALNRWLR